MEFKPIRHGVDSVLAMLWRNISRNVSTANTIRYINEYLRRRSEYKSAKELSSDRSTIQKELCSDRMTWKKFCQGLEILKINKIHIMIDVEWGNKQVTRHDQVVIFNPVINEHIEEKDDATRT